MRKYYKIILKIFSFQVTIARKIEVLRQIIHGMNYHIILSFLVRGSLGEGPFVELSLL